jgi:hypothetical protein
MKRQRNGRAPGENQLTAELLKCGGTHLIDCLHRLISEIRERVEMPEEWKTGLICPIFKKGDKLNYSNYRGSLCLMLHTKSSLVSCRED